MDTLHYDPLCATKKRPWTTLEDTNDDDDMGFGVQDVVDAVIDAFRTAAVDLGVDVYASTVPYPPHVGKSREPYLVSGVGVRMTAAGDMEHESLALQQLQQHETNGSYALRFARLKPMLRVAEELGSSLGASPGPDAERLVPGLDRADGRPLILFWVPYIIRSRVTGEVVRKDPEGDEAVIITFRGRDAPQ